MEKSELLYILEDWNLWNKDDFDTGVLRRGYLSQFSNYINQGQVIAVMGARRSGKSYLMRQWMEYLVREKGVPKSDILMVNFEDARLVSPDNHLLDDIFSAFVNAQAPKGMPYLFFDEVQAVNEWERWVRTMHELKKATIIVSGSNSALLGTEPATLLTGRHLDIVVSPLSFSEFLLFKNVCTPGESEAQFLLHEYLEHGAFPAVVLGERKRDLLIAYFGDVLEKDLFRRFHVRKKEHLRSLTKYYLSNIATLTTAHSLEKIFGVSADTIEKFSRYLENAYCVHFNRRFSFKVKEQEKSPKKVYAIDTGLAHAVGFRLSENIGRAAENCVFLELKRRHHHGYGRELFYWKDEQHREVDFVVKEGTKIVELIQVVWDLVQLQTKQREVKSLLKAMHKLSLRHGMILTRDVAAEEWHDGMLITFIPLWKWLLE